MTHIEKHQTRTGKETIHSGHFMVSHFEAEEQDDFDDLAVPVPDEEQTVQKNTVVAMYTVPGTSETYTLSDKEESKQHQQLSIEISLTKLFRCMSLAYRQKLTSPKWNRFKGIKLRWKDKIRLNNVIWRCWHMQFIKKQDTFVCQFASPLDVDTHVKPETTILEGKYWKRRAEAVIAEYKKWRMFHIMRLLGKGDTSVQDTMSDMDTVESFSQCSDLAANMLTDEDYLNFMSDTLFSTITNHQPFAFPDCREIARGAGLADFIQPSLGPLQPNLDDFMDTLEPLQDLLSMPRLPPVPEETTIPSEDALYRTGMSVDSYNPQGYIAGSQNTSAVTMPTSQMSIHGTSNNTQSMSMPEQVKGEEMRMYDNIASEPALPQASVMLAQLLSAHHSQNLYTIKGSDEGAGGSEPTKSPIRRAQPSPIENEVMSPHQSLSPPGSPASPRAGSPRESREARRSHLHTEQKRRYNIKNGFDTLQTLIPHLNTNPAAKISKAAMLQKGAEYIKQLKAERNQIKEEMESLRAQIDCLNNSISNCHSMLPATGAPVSRARAGRLREMFARHVAARTLHNWKYWLFSVVSAALVESFSACVSCGSGADLVRTTLLWAEQHCSLVEMRPAVLNSLRVLCTTTDILTSPERLPEESREI
ncbi:PREDICTED: MLX-interacting protein [Papilio polytes]|uniref:MLX-interacting protein n=1 Tax=Papilio polytes TaxID=76194 RepID=UPI00067631B7|nr:PREDICTED: MLX-interacting protein [Papilio polytes]